VVFRAIAQLPVRATPYQEVIKTLYEIEEGADK